MRHYFRTPRLTLKERRDFLETEAGEFARWNHNRRAWKDQIERIQDSVSRRPEVLTERLSELKSSASLSWDDSEVPNLIAHATAVLTRAEDALRDMETANLVQAMDLSLS